MSLTTSLTETLTGSLPRPSGATAAAADAGARCMQHAAPHVQRTSCAKKQRPCSAHPHTRPARAPRVASMPCTTPINHPAAAPWRRLHSGRWLDGDELNLEREIGIRRNLVRSDVLVADVGGHEHGAAAALAHAGGGEPERGRRLGADGAAEEAASGAVEGGGARLRCTRVGGATSARERSARRERGASIAPWA